jgi:hypothetical protein
MKCGFSTVDLPSTNSFMSATHEQQRDWGRDNKHIIHWENKFQIYLHMLRLRLANSPLQHHAIHKLWLSFSYCGLRLQVYVPKLSKPQYQALLVLSFNVKTFR